MSSNRPQATFWISTWWPVALAIVVISLESTMAMGADHTTGPLHAIFLFLFGPKIDPVWDHIHFMIRKSGHFIGYGLVGLAWFRAWKRTLPTAAIPSCVLLAIPCAFLIASLDEWHQSLLPNRTGHFSDVLLDTAGAVILILIDSLLLALLHRRSVLARTKS